MENSKIANATLDNSTLQMQRRTATFIWRYQATENGGNPTFDSSFHNLINTKLIDHYLTAKLS